MLQVRLPDAYSIDGAADEEIGTLIAIDLAAGTLFEDTGLIADEAMDDHVPEEVFASAIQHGHVFTVRDADGVPVGFTLTSSRGDTLYLDQISVHPDHGRQGLGKALVARVIKEAKLRKLRGVTLSTFRDLAWNGPFYRRLGFREIARAKLADWMLDLENAQAASLDISKRCFMHRKIGWL